MRKIYLFLFFALAIHFNQASAQSTNCNAGFQYNISGLNVVFNPAMIGDSINTFHLWTFGDGTASNLAAPLHAYTAGGVYTVKHLIKKINATGVIICTDTLVQTITLQNAPSCNLQASFTVQHDSIVWNKFYFINHTISLAATDSVRWTFGDGTTPVYTHNAVHVFANPGVYNVCLRVKRNNTAGTPPCVSEICTTVTVAASPSPACNLQAYFNFVRDSSIWNKYYFTNLTAGLNPTDTIRWTFGDGTPAFYGLNAVHSFANAGTYNVCIRIARPVPVGAAPCVREFCKTVVVVAPTVACNLQANFIAIRDSSNHKKFYFNNTTVNILPTDSVRWTFGDGTPAVSTLNAVHTFANYGHYNVCLRVKRMTNTGAVACVTEYCRLVIADSSNTSSLCNNYFVDFASHADSSNHLKIYFSNTSYHVAGAIATWRFGDGTMATGWNANHVYNALGTYNVCLRIQYANGCVKEKCRVITIQQPGIAVCTLQPYPNPVYNIVNASVSLPQPYIIYSRIYNSSNVIVRQKQQNGSTGFNTVSFDNLGNLPSGVYRLVIQYGNKQCVGLFMKY